MRELFKLAYQACRVEGFDPTDGLAYKAFRCYMDGKRKEMTFLERVVLEPSRALRGVHFSRHQRIISAAAIAMRRIKEG
jgi:hypothetical protein